MLAHADMSNSYWGEAVLTTTYLMNRLTTSALQEDKTLYEMWYEKRPDTSHLQVIGCVEYAHIPDCERQKLDKMAKQLILVGYCKNFRGYSSIMKALRGY